jgi:hypothetical protein
LLDFSFERWVDYLLDVPLLFRRTAQDRWLPGGGLSFRTWMALDQGPSWDDWDLHMTSVFPEVRIKHAIEVRGADCVPHPLAMAFVALFKVLLYEAPAMDRALELAGAFSSVGTGAERFAVACRDGLRGSLGDRALSDWAAELVQVALDAAGPEDRAWMAPLVEQVERGESPGHTMLRRLEEAEGAAAKLIAMGAVEPEAEEGARGGRAGQLSVAGELEQVIARCGALRRQLKALRRRTGLPVRRTRRQLRKLERVLRGLVLQLVEQELASGRMGEVMVATSAYVDALDGFGAPDSREELRVVRKRTRAFRKRLEQDVKGDAAFG